MGTAAEWLREERRKTLGDWVAICASCGHGQRYFADSEEEVEPVCPTCAEALLTRCPGCRARISSMFATRCEACEAPLRAGEQFGTSIRRHERRGTRS